MDNLIFLLVMAIAPVIVNKVLTYLSIYKWEKQSKYKPTASSKPTEPITKPTYRHIPNT